MSSDEENPNGTQKIVTTISDLLRASAMMDRLLAEAVESGIDTGRSLGAIEAYNLLMREGHTDAARVVLELVEDEMMYRKSIGDA